MGINQIPDPYNRPESVFRRETKSANYYVYEIIASGHYENIRKFIQYLSSLLYTPVLTLPHRNPVQLSVYREKSWIYHDIELIDMNQLKADEILDKTDIHYIYSLETYRIYIESYWPLRDEAFRMLKGWVNFNIKNSLVPRHGISFNDQSMCQDNTIASYPQTNMIYSNVKTAGFSQFATGYNFGSEVESFECGYGQTNAVLEEIKVIGSVSIVNAIETGIDIPLEIENYLVAQGIIDYINIGLSSGGTQYSSPDMARYAKNIIQYWTFTTESVYLNYPNITSPVKIATKTIHPKFSTYYDNISYIHINWSNIWKFFIPETVWSAEYPNGKRLKELKAIADSKMETGNPRRPSSSTNLIYVHQVKLRDIVVDVNYKRKGQIIPSTGFYGCIDTWWYDTYRTHFPNHNEWYYRHEKGVAEILYEEYCNDVIKKLKERSRVCSCCYHFCDILSLPYDVEICYFQLNFMRVPAYHKRIPIWCFLYPIRIPPNWKTFIFSKQYLPRKEDVYRFMYVYDYNLRQYFRQFYYSYCSAVSKSLSIRHI